MRPRLIALLLILGLLVPSLAADARPRRPRGPADPTRPNIVLIVTDDMRADDLAAMPNTRALLGNRGATFTAAFNASPSCCPSRASIFRGQYVHNHLTWTNAAPYGGWERYRRDGNAADDLPTWLRARGYRTALFGKYLNEYGFDRGAEEQPAGWTDWSAYEASQKYYDYDLNLGRVGLVHYGKDPTDYATDVLGRSAATFITKEAGRGLPFFAYVAPCAPHGPALPAPRHIADPVSHQAPRSAAYDEEDVSDKPPLVSDLPRLSSNRRAEIRDLHARRVRTLYAVDEAVVRIYTAVQKARLLGSTYFVFTSDNGYHLGEHRRWMGKGTAYEESIRAPLLIAGPGIPPGTVVPRVASLADLAPTIADWAGANPSYDPDGRSLTPLLRGGNDVPWRSTVLVEFGLRGTGLVGGLAYPTFRMVRTEEWAYVEYEDGFRELYDMDADPAQLKNLLAPGREPSPEAAVLEARLAALEACAGGSCRTADS